MGAKGILRPRDEHRGIAVLVAIATIPRATCADIVVTTGIPRRSVLDVLAKLRSLNTKIERVESKRSGYYVVDDAGAFDIEGATKVLGRNFPAVLKSINERANSKET